MELTLEEALQKAVETHKAGQIQEADRLYTAILQAQPKHPDANHNMGVLATGVGKVQEALPFFKAALEANPSMGQYWLSYIDALIKLDQMADAKTVLNQAKGKEANGEAFDQLEQRLNAPNDTPVETNLHNNDQDQTRENALDKLNLDQAIKIAKKKLKEGSSEDAKRIYNDILARFPKNKKALEGIKSLSGGFIGKTLKVQEPPQDQLQPLINLYQQGQLQQALDSAKKLLSQFPNSLILYNIQGAANAGLGQLDAAIGSYKQALKIKPDYADAYNNMGAALKDKGDLGAAIGSYKQALKIKPEYADAYCNMGVALIDKGDVEAAIESFKKALKIKPDFAEAYNNMGNALKDKGDLEAAIDNYKQALKSKPEYAEAYNNMGTALKNKGDLKAAIDSCKQALKIKPDFAEAHNNLGVTLQELGRKDEAEASYKQAIALKPDFAEAHFNLGVFLFESRIYKLAEEQFDLSGTYKGKLYSIQCSYLQDEETIFYEKYELLANQVETNAVLGSLGFRSEFKYGIKKSNSFCNDPLKYVVKTDLNALYDFENIFIETVRDVLSDNSVSLKSQGHLTKGIQTAGNIFAQGKVPKTEIESIIHIEIEKYRIQFKDSEEGFIKSWPTSYEIKGWLVCMQSGGKLAPHMHDSGWITGSIYINVPPKSKIDCGNLVLCLSDQDHVLGVEKNQQNSIDVVTGSLCLFPSSLHHYTVPFEEKEDRIVLAFDVIPKN